VTPDAVRAAARAWSDDDPDPVTRAQVAALLADGDEPALRARFAGRLVFGTAGLRGPVRAGPTGMNLATVRRTAAGIAAHLGPGRAVVVGRDARHGSKAFARETCAVLAGAGLRARLLPGAVPTPVLAHAVLVLDADAGVMVTASHNPRQDNGVKVYLADGAQVVPPVDAAIEAAAAAVTRVLDLPMADTFEQLDEAPIEHYLDAVAALPLTRHREVRVAYTPLHGVGAAVLLGAFARAGFPGPTVVTEQAEPDPDFPTVAFPNPEEPGALDRVLALAASVGADIAIASDPDADRIAVAVGGRVLTGDEVGVLLADHVLSCGRLGRVATTVVSSSMLARIASAYAVPYSETLTGFKWLARAGSDLVYAYEEALGVAVAPDVVRDKDGISAALLVADLAAFERARGRTLLDRLADLERRHGRHATRQLSYRVADPVQAARTVQCLVSRPPTGYGALTVTSVEQPAADVLVHRLVAGRIVLRPSGTEPKLKAYLELVDPPPGAMDALTAAVDARLKLSRTDAENLQ